MIVISHRGNLDGPKPDRENRVTYLEAALAAGFDVECDVWLVKDKLYLGHDTPGELAPQALLANPRCWVHAKNAQALGPLLELKVHCFFHDQDRATLTSQQWVWCLVGHYLPGARCVCLLPEVGGYLPGGAVCTDYCTSPQVWTA